MEDEVIAASAAEQFSNFLMCTRTSLATVNTEEHWRCRGRNRLEVIVVTANPVQLARGKLSVDEGKGYPRVDPEVPNRGRPCDEMKAIQIQCRLNKCIE